jgi:DNA polymerase III subunit delta'
MSWQQILGHDQVVEQFRRRIAGGRMASTFLFVGPAGIGKRTLALKLAQTLLCERVPDEQMAPCGECPSCRQVLAESHPDLIMVSKPADKSYIPIELLIGDREHRMREGLCHDISRKPNRGSRKVAIVDDADYFNQEGANSLLKTLEEPPPRAVLILLGTSEQRQLSTIRSRSQIVRFEPLSRDHCAHLLLEQGLVESASAAEELADLSGGSLEAARELLAPELREFRHRFVARLAERDWDSVALSKAVSSFVDEAGKEASARRERLRQLIRFAVEFYRSTMLHLVGGELPADATLRSAVQSASAAGHSPSTAADSIERSLEALQHVAGNANQATAIECWLDDLASLSRGEYLPHEA